MLARWEKDENSSITTLVISSRNADIIIPGASCISKVSCLFEIDPDTTNVVMFYDKSYNLST